MGSGESVKISGANAKVTLRGATLTSLTNGNTSPVHVTAGGVTIYLEGDNTLTSSQSTYPGIRCAESGTTTIEVKSGSTTIRGGNGGAGIGSSSNSSCGNISLKVSTSCELEVIGGTSAAGIGCGQNGVCGNITITTGLTGANSNVTVKGNVNGSDSASYGDIGKWDTGTVNGNITINHTVLPNSTNTSAIKGRSGGPAQVRK